MSDVDALAKLLEAAFSPDELRDWLHDREGYRIDNNASRSYQARTGLTAQLHDNLRYSGSFAFGCARKGAA